MSNKPQLLTETVSYIKGITEKEFNESKEKNDGKLILTGIIQKANTKNANNRYYPIEGLIREDRKYQEKINENKSWGECDHPDSPTVEFKNVSHRIRRTWWEGNDLHGDLLILDGYTPCGTLVAGLIQSGGTVGISSRAVGSVKRANEGYDIVGDDLNLISYDIVSENSTPNAVLSLKEGIEIDLDKYPELRLVKIEQILNEILNFNEKEVIEKIENELN
ncbi:MAG: hypothetical protein ACREQ5_32910 [Candidatus Dormibacteria bacterium]